MEREISCPECGEEWIYTVELTMDERIQLASKIETYLIGRRSKRGQTWYEIAQDIVEIISKS